MAAGTELRVETGVGVVPVGFAAESFKQASEPSNEAKKLLGDLKGTYSLDGSHVLAEEELCKLSKAHSKAIAASG
jgi:hypothetical protein